MSVPANTKSSVWYSWARLDSGMGMNTIDLDHHLRSLGWAVALVIFSFIVLAWDTRQETGLRSRRAFNLRDRIFGIEQRYFLALFNGLLLYVSLVFMLERN